MDASGYHGPSCRRSAGRHPRHSQINDIINLALGRADIPAMKEPSGLVVGSAVRPVGVTLIPWIRGRCLAWDATTPDTFAASHFARTSSPAGAAASHAAEAKIQKYESLSASHFFVPVAIETTGVWCEEGLNFIRELGRRTSLITSDPRETSFLLQKISVAVQRGNAISVGGTPPAPSGLDDH